MVIDAVTIGETRVLRDPAWFREIQRVALAPMIGERRRTGAHHLRLWCAGCSTGEEAYTLAMMLSDCLPDLPAWSIEIIASDLRVDALATARRGEYSERSLREAPADWIDRYFEPTRRGRHRVSDRIRRIIRFRQVNLSDDIETLRQSMGFGFDLILCRNVLMYLAEPVQVRVAATLRAALAPRGWLAVSPAEASAQWFRGLRPVSSLDAILFEAAPPMEPPKATSRTAPWDASRPTARPISRIDGTLAAPPSAAGTSASRMESPPSPKTVETRTVLSPSSSPDRGGNRDTTLNWLRRMADRGLREEARAQCLALLDQRGPHRDLYLLLSEICADMGNFDAARDAARKAIQLDASSAAAHYLLGHAQRNRGALLEARRSMRQVLMLTEVLGTAQRATDGVRLNIDQIRYAATLFLTGDAPMKKGASNGT
nr:CheR family methyltransferase [Marivibrio halodurans]